MFLISVLAATSPVPSSACNENVLLRPAALAESLGDAPRRPGHLVPWLRESGVSLAHRTLPARGRMRGDASLQELADWLSLPDRRTRVGADAAWEAYLREPNGEGSELLGVAAMMDRSRGPEITTRLFDRDGVGGPLAARFATCDATVLASLPDETLARLDAVAFSTRRPMDSELVVESFTNLVVEWARRGEGERAAHTLRRLVALPLTDDCDLGPRPMARNPFCAIRSAQVAAIAGALEPGLAPEWDDHPTTRFARAAACPTPPCEHVGYTWTGTAWTAVPRVSKEIDACALDTLDRLGLQPAPGSSGAATFSGQCNPGFTLG